MRGIALTRHSSYSLRMPRWWKRRLGSRDLMKDKTRALRALERAWKKMPRGAGTAIRISKIHAKAGRTEAEKAVLDEALTRDSAGQGGAFRYGDAPAFER